MSEEGDAGTIRRQASTRLKDAYWDCPQQTFRRRSGIQFSIGGKQRERRDNDTHFQGGSQLYGVIGPQRVQIGELGSLPQQRNCHLKDAVILGKIHPKLVQGRRSLGDGERRRLPPASDGGCDLDLCDAGDVEKMPTRRSCEGTSPGRARFVNINLTAASLSRKKEATSTPLADDGFRQGFYLDHDPA